ncbi:ferric reductase-like transmembrane domain-containing protein [Streptomyces radiopugnans]|uniref:Ferric reductase like transmembrane component n=1 Tax=Streptomyces radiopugnans TaxID=403935 RepID=A0A1H9K5I0_9ACTN|nr:ferric reductase-like transmembrane domain-containing protein [Streptomyces radiopugnans]SEQ94332.1 Ferric reductase like transmembrane component [Streptomyces radiopugnans]
MVKTPVRAERHQRFDLPALRADLRAALPDATAALVITAGLFAWLYARVESGVSMTLQVMPDLADAGRYWMYWLCQAFGWTGLLWAWITVMLGLIRSSARPGWLRVQPVRIERWHRTTSLTTIGLMFAHAALFFAELVRTNEEGAGWAGRVATSFAEVFVPGVYSSGTGRIAILVGLLALYLAVPLGLAFYLRQATGSRMWRALHRFVIVVYVLSVWHTLLYGTNVWYDGVFRTTVWLLQLPVALLLLVRLLAPARSGERLRLRDASRRPGALPLAAHLAGRVAAAAFVVGLLVVAATGRDGGRTPGVAGAGLNVTQTQVWVGLAVLLVVIAAVIHRLRPAPRTPAPGPTAPTPAARPSGSGGEHGER